jgi:hypothetical protein
MSENSITEVLNRLLKVGMDNKLHLVTNLRIDT